VCGFSGELRLDGATPDIGAVARMTEAMTARGPDGHGLYASGPIALGHRRLSIIDLSACGSQPMHDADLGLTIAYNGCIYNYRSCARS
jgi:asparagine synthase (glutamine-hydrolysing)